MSWKFWHKQTVSSQEAANAGAKLPKPKEMPEAVGRYLVVALRQDPDWVWNLKCVLLPGSENKSLFDFRVFDQTRAMAGGIAVKNYHSLDAHPELVVFSGWMDKATRQVHIDPVKKAV